MKKHEKIFLFLSIYLLFSELIKQLLLTALVNRGTYDWWYFPFQLCSLPMYLLPAFLLLKSTYVRQIILTFLMTYNFLGGIAVFFDTSGMHYPLSILTFHSFTWHILLIVIGIAAGILLFKFYRPNKRNARIILRTFLESTCLYLLLCLAAFCLNLIVTPSADINMFYINPAFPMEQIFFNGIAASYGNNFAIFFYMFTTICGSFLLFLLWNAIFSQLKKKN